MTEKEWQDRYEITSTKGRIWKRSELLKRAAEMLKTLSPSNTPVARRIAALAVLDDAAFMRPRRGEVPARVIEAVAIEAMLRLARKDSALAMRRLSGEDPALAEQGTPLAEVKKEDDRG